MPKRERDGGAAAAASAASIPASSPALPELPQRGLFNHLFKDSVLPPFTPTVPLALVYNGVSVEYGTDLEVSQTKKEPTVRLGLPSTPSSSSVYTLIGFDPDAPSRHEPTQRSWLCCLVVDIPSSCTELLGGAGAAPKAKAGKGADDEGSGDAPPAPTPTPYGGARGHTVVSYAAPNPSRGSHRFVFLLVRQAKAFGTASAAPPAPAMRIGFDVAQFLAGPCGVGGAGDGDGGAAGGAGGEIVGINFFLQHPPDFPGGGGGKKKR
jgi:phosphatidylethanolamine-binding protein (PEBP) family uncharacterized protein